MFRMQSVRRRARRRHVAPRAPETHRPFAWAGMAGASRGFVCSPAEAATESVDTLYVGGPIVTINDAQPTAEAVLVRGGKIVAVGPRAEVEKQAQGPIGIVDLEGKALLPGFVDPHGHVVMVGLQALAANLLPPPDGEGADIPALQRILSDWIGRNGKVIERYGVIVGFGYDDSQLEEQRHPTRADLDAVSSDMPILIVHQSGHLGVLNSKALKRRADEGHAQSARRRVPARGRRGDPERRLRGGGLLRRGRQAAWPARRAGLSRHDQGGRGVLRLVRLHDRSGRPRHAREHDHAPEGGRGGAAQRGRRRLSRRLSVPEGHRALARLQNRVRVGGAKATIDGSPQGKTAFLSQPYYKPPEDRTPTIAATRRSPRSRSSTPSTSPSPTAGNLTHATAATRSTGSSRRSATRPPSTAPATGARSWSMARRRGSIRAYPVDAHTH